MAHTIGRVEISEKKPAIKPEDPELPKTKTPKKPAKMTVKE